MSPMVKAPANANGFPSGSSQASHLGHLSTDTQVPQNISNGTKGQKMAHIIPVIYKHKSALKHRNFLESVNTLIDTTAA